jgi:HAD superfamily hydrolase (TIGR01484 family)
MLLVFDVDGTLTPSRGRINEEFRNWMLTELRSPFVLVTGSDPIKTREQIGNELYDSTIVFNCTGNHVFNRGAEIYRSRWRIPESLKRHLEQVLENGLYQTKTGNHIEQRIGLCNFSMVGRNADHDQRKAYFDWDQISNERYSIAHAIRIGWPNIDASVAGETGIDIYQNGTGKDQILPALLEIGNDIRFFGDRMEENGNDHKLAVAITTGGHGQAYHVSDWQETWNLLKSI